MGRLLLIFVLLLPLSARAQSLDLESVPEWQPSWRFASGVIALGAGAALLSLSYAYGRRVLYIEDRAIAASEAAEVATTEAQLLRLRDRIDQLNQRGSELETRHLATLASGAVLFAGGLALVLWDRLRESDPFQVVLSPSGVAVRLDW